MERRPGVPHHHPTCPLRSPRHASFHVFSDRPYRKPRLPCIPQAFAAPFCKNGLLQAVASMSYLCHDVQPRPCILCKNQGGPMMCLICLLGEIITFAAPRILFFLVLVRAAQVVQSARPTIF